MVRIYIKYGSLACHRTSVDSGSLNLESGEKSGEKYLLTETHSPPPLAAFGTRSLGVDA